jgi:hypothetical protein
LRTSTGTVIEVLELPVGAAATSLTETRAIWRPLTSLYVSFDFRSSLRVILSDPALAAERVAVPIGFFTPFVVAVAMTEPIPFACTTKLKTPLCFFRPAAFSCTAFVPCASDGASVHFCVADGCRRNATGAVGGDVQPTALA